MKTQVTVESITTDLDRIAAGAEAAAQWAAAKGAVETKAKLHGLLVDRKETGGPGEFAGLSTAEDVLALVKAELGDGIAAALARVLEAGNVDQAAIDSAPRTATEALN